MRKREIIRRITDLEETLRETREYLIETREYLLIHLQERNPNIEVTSCLKGGDAL